MATSKPKAEKHLNRGAQAEALALLLSESADLKAVFSEVDPYSASFKNDLEESLRVALSGHLNRLTAKLVMYSSESAIRHLWATAVLSPVNLALLFRCLSWSDDPEMNTLANKLLKLTPNVIERDLVAQTVAFTPPLAPDLSRCEFLMPGIRIRYALANKLNAGATTAELVEATVAVKNGSDYVRRRELHRLITHCDAVGNPLARYPLTDLMMRPQREHRLL